MSRATFHHECTECKRSNDYETAWINPELYTDPEKATKTFSFWCKDQSCGRGQAVLLQMIPDNEVLVADIVDYRSLIKEDSPSYYINSKDNDKDNESPEQLTENASMFSIGKGQF